MAVSTSSLGRAVSEVLRARPYRYLAVALFLPALALYLLTLPATHTGGTIGLVSLRYLNAELAFFSVTLALLLSLAVTLNIYGFCASLRQRGAALSAGAVLASLVPSSVCCTSLVPSLLAAMGASTPQIFGLTGRIQGTVASSEPVFLAGAAALLLLSLGLAAWNIAGACALPVKGGHTDAPERSVQA